MIKKVAASLLIVLLFNINGFSQSQLSSAQLYLHQLLDTYKRLYATTKDEAEKTESKKNFGMAVKHFLVDSMKQQTDSLTVRVGRIKLYKNNSIATQLFSGEIEFSYYSSLEQLPKDKRAAVREFLLALQPQSIVRVNFIHQKGSIIVSPDKRGFKPLTLFAFPMPLNLGSNIEEAANISLLQ